jgi:structural maintenance of chromosome 3 (chondroitin sulfate proteoglycan 6)
MHIKKVIIKGFKTYASQLDFDTFHSRSNVIVGKNGAGKSNFIDAIRFVLSSDKYRKLRSEERKALLHQGPGDTVLSGYVEIHFDNTDKRLPVDSAEVILRRNIGLKKDEYYLNNKHVSAEDVMNLLESAGFSRSNPYYIVIQGQVQALAKMKPSERLELLKEVAGTSVYEERKSESLKIMAETESKKAKIAEVLAYINERLKELESEKEELKEYQQLDRERRALEYCIFDHELKETEAKLNEIESNRQEEAENFSEDHMKTIEAQENLKNAEKSLKNLITEQQKLTRERDFLQEEKQEYLKARARLELEIADVAAKLAIDKKKQDGIQKELSKVKEEIRKVTQLLEEVQPRFEAAVKREQEIKESIAEKERRVQELYAKQGRKKQFRSKKERDEWIAKELEEIRKAKETKQKQIEVLEEEIKTTMSKIEEPHQQSTMKAQSAEEVSKAYEKLNNEYNALKVKRDDLANRRKADWREQSEREARILELKNELLKYERQLQSSVSKEINMGLSAVKKIKQAEKLTGVYGPLIELFDVADEFVTAVEVTAGNSLFYVVVDTDDTATSILEQMARDKSGRVTFVPLNQLAAKEISYPNTGTARPLTDILSYDKPTLHKAFVQIFGKTLLCPTLEVAAAISKSHQMNCVTPNGDQVNAKGALTGGYYDPRFSRIRAMKAIKKLREQLKEEMQQASKLKTRIDELDQRITQYINEMQQVDTRRAKQRETVETLNSLARAAAQELLFYRDSLSQKERLLAEYKATITQFDQTIEALKKEGGTPLLDKLSPEEQQLLHQLNEELKKLNEELLKLTEERAKLERDKRTYDNTLRNKLLKRQDELSRQLSEIELHDQQTNFIRLETHLKEVEASIEENTKKQQELMKKIDENAEAIKKLKAQIETLKGTEQETTKELQLRAKKMEKLLNARSLLLQKKEECMRKIREIGSLPSEAYEKFQGEDLENMVKKLKEVKAKLKGFTHVNKKALDQYVNFTEQQQELQKRKDEVDEAEKSIALLIENLDKKKDEAIERTFKGVAKSFSDVFNELTGGTGTLVMQKKDVPRDVQESESTARIRAYRGVDIKVQFPGSTEQHMAALSGGQQSLVALSLIFAIQRCDPAPFYVFDEIDPALDDKARLAVAQMIKKQSKNIQFIMTTHRPELVEHAHKWYKIVHHNKVSNIFSVSKEEALALLREVEQEELEQQIDRRETRASRTEEGSAQEQ